MNTKQVSFKGFYNAEQTKKQVYLHHTAGAGDGASTFAYWDTNSENIATCVVISKDGTIVQGFDSKFWAYHLGLKSSHFQGLPYINLDKTSIGIEIVNYGYLTEKKGKFYSYTNKEVKDVCTLDVAYKGYKHFENYTDKQIDSVHKLLIHWQDKYAIDLTYNEDIWQVTKRALSCKNGVYTHNSVRADKIDVYPHPKLIAMLKSL